MPAPAAGTPIRHCHRPLPGEEDDGCSLAEVDSGDEPASLPAAEEELDPAGAVVVSAAAGEELSGEPDEPLCEAGAEAASSLAGGDAGVLPEPASVEPPDVASGVLEDPCSGVLVDVGSVLAGGAASCELAVAASPEAGSEALAMATGRIANQAITASRAAQSQALERPFPKTPAAVPIITASP